MPRMLLGPARALPCPLPEAGAVLLLSWRAASIGAPWAAACRLIYLFVTAGGIDPRSPPGAPPAAAGLVSGSSRLLLINSHPTEPMGGVRSPSRLCPWPACRVTPTGRWLLGFGSPSAHPEFSGVAAGCQGPEGTVLGSQAHVSSPWSPCGHGRDIAVALEISCLETSVEVEDLIVSCSRGTGGSSWAPPAFPRCAEHPASPESQGSQASPVPRASCGTQSPTQSSGQCLMSPGVPSPGCSVSRWELL